MALMRVPRPLVFVSACVAIGACAGANSDVHTYGPSARASDEGPPAVDDVAKRTALCARSRTDSVRDIFCSANPPEIRILRDLQTQLGLTYDASVYGPVDADPVIPVYLDTPAEPQLVVLSSSTALPSRFISTINPRAIMLG